MIKILLLLALCAGARADEDAATVEARKAYLEGVELVKRAQWSEALGAFERSALLKPHPTTTFSMGACQRAMGRYTRARANLKLALSQTEEMGRPMPADLLADAQAFIAEIDRLLAVVEVHLEPAEGELTVDGRPLLARRAGARPALVAGILPPGKGGPPPGNDFDLYLDPGTHVISVERAGYTTALVSRTFSPGSRTQLPLVLDKLPATIHIAANQPGAVIDVDDIDVGVAPVEVQRPAGSYRVTAKKKGFSTYQTRVNLQAGERVDLSAPLAIEKRPIHKQWWFWTTLVLGVGTVVGIAVGASQPPPPYQGGSTGWVAGGH